MGSKEWSNEVSCAAGIPDLKRPGIPLESLEQWASGHKAQFVVKI